jgi:aminoglycoside/choline kinase family phosphotransferase
MNSSTPKDERRALLDDWLPVALGAVPCRVAPVSADASFRRYFRVWHEAGTLIAMDAPPEREDLRPYLQVAELLAATGVNVPRIVARNPVQGFLLLSDLGDLQYLDALCAGDDPEPLYRDAIDALVRIQSRAPAATRQLPEYDRQRLHDEMELFPVWFVGRHLGLQLSGGERDMLDASFEFLSKSALAQPSVLVHRDYHSRNLMVCLEANPGILDFQDAVRGAISYDLVSLLKDCYVTWPRERLLAWLDRYREMAGRAGLDPGADRGEFVLAFDLMGLQRHIKVLGIFARLWYRDGKRGYLADLPRVLDYVLEASACHRDLEDFRRFLEARVLPAFAGAQARAERAG